MARTALSSMAFRARFRRPKRCRAILAAARTPLDLALWLDVSADTISDRISHRLQCQSCGFTTSEGSAGLFGARGLPVLRWPTDRRTDDDAPVLRHALREFNTKTQPLGAFYEKLGALRKIDGNRDRDAVFADISRLIEQAA